MKFAFVMSEEVGLRTQYLNWRKHFPKDLGIEPHWITISFDKPGGWIEKLPGIPFKSRIRAALEIREGLRSGPFDATFIGVHSALATMPGYLSKYACFTTLDVTPKQLHAFGELYGKYPSKIPVVEAAKHRSRARNFNRYRALFPWSHWAADSLVDDYGVNRDRVHVIPPGVDIDQWRPPTETSQDEHVNLLFVGGDFERKGGELLLEWARTTSSKNWRLNIVTRKKLSLTDDRITVHNNLSSNDPALTQLYRTSNIFVLPTFADCYSIAGIEALASGLPVLLSKTGGTGDVILDGKTGYLLETQSINEVDYKLNQLINDLEIRKRMSVAARNDANLRYDVVKNIRKTVGIMLDQL
jgi:glycosyltransferase involved in cell wall biosynthesis